MSSSVAIRRLRKEYQLLLAAPEYGISAAPIETNVLEWHFVLSGCVETSYQGGLYHGKLLFPANFPMKPPSITMLTESGRFEVGKKICMSMSDFHPELWNPLWGVRSILVGMLSFMNGEEQTTGGVIATAAQRRLFAQRSLGAIKADAIVMELFPDIISQADSNLTFVADNWPPPLPLPLPMPPTAATAAEEKSAAPDTISTVEDDVKSSNSASSNIETAKSKSAKNNAKRRAKSKAVASTAAARDVTAVAAVSNDTDEDKDKSVEDAHKQLTEHHDSETTDDTMNIKKCGTDCTS